jgi:hypothetical protein
MLPERTLAEAVARDPGAKANEIWLKNPRFAGIFPFQATPTALLVRCPAL